MREGLRAGGWKGNVQAPWGMTQLRLFVSRGVNTDVDSDELGEEDVFYIAEEEGDTKMPEARKIRTISLCVIFSTLLTAAAAVTDPVDAVALKALHRTLQDPLGRLISWGSGDPCDDTWEGVICESSSNSVRVTELHLMNHDLSGSIAPELGDMSNLQILNLMWNRISGSIPASLGKLKALRLLLLNGNHLTGTIPNEIGNLISMNRFQIDENQISGSIPSTFGNLVSVKHLHMNNNSLTGSIPAELGRLPALFHLLLDNNNLSGLLPPALSNISTFEILQLDNNKFDNSTIPPSYSNLKALAKLSLKNCNLQGAIPDISGLPALEFLDLSSNQLSETIPDSFPSNITTINLSDNLLVGKISASFAHLEDLQVLLLKNNKLNGTIAVDFLKRNNSSEKRVLDFQNNLLSNFSGDLNDETADEVDLWLFGNSKICDGKNPQFAKFCLPETFDAQADDEFEDNIPNCDPTICAPRVSELVPALASEGDCKCAAPIRIACRLKSPGFTFFYDKLRYFEEFMADGLDLLLQQVHVASYTWEPGPRLFINLKIFPSMTSDTNRRFNSSEVLRIFEAFTGWRIPDNLMFGPRELISFDPPVGIELFPSKSSRQKGISTGTVVAIVLGIIAGTAIIVTAVVFGLVRKHKLSGSASRKSLLSRKTFSTMKIENVKDFTIQEMHKATDSFSEARKIGKGGYGTVYKGVLEDQQVVAIKRAGEDSHQGEREFFTEIELLSRIHHRNLVSLIGFCLDDGEQMLVYEYVAGGSLQERLSANPPLNFKTRVHIALGAARGILYLHTEANPPIIHRDIKGTNILLGEKNNAKVADFGLSKLAPEEEVEGVSGHVSTVVKGTPGYLDPEYFLTRKLSDKSDIYSFGVVLLELITGKHAIFQGKNLVREVRQTYEAGVVLSIIDPRTGPYPSEALEPLVRLALSCCADSAEKRPSIRIVVRDLEDIWKSIATLDYSYHDEAKLAAAFRSSGYLSFDDSLASSSQVDKFSGTIGAVVPR